MFVRCPSMVGDQARDEAKGKQKGKSGGRGQARQGERWGRPGNAVSTALTMCGRKRGDRKSGKIAATPGSPEGIAPTMLSACITRSTRSRRRRTRDVNQIPRVGQQDGKKKFITTD